MHSVFEDSHQVALAAVVNTCGDTAPDGDACGPVTLSSSDANDAGDAAGAETEDGSSSEEDRVQMEETQRRSIAELRPSVVCATTSLLIVGQLPLHLCLCIVPTRQDSQLADYGAQEADVFIWLGEASPSVRARARPAAAAPTRLSPGPRVAGCGRHRSLSLPGQQDPAARKLRWPPRRLGHRPRGRAPASQSQ